MQEKRSRWFGHVMRREEVYVGKIVMTLEVQGMKQRGRPKQRWTDKIKEDMEEKGVQRERLEAGPSRVEATRQIDRPHMKGDKTRKKKNR